MTVLRRMVSGEANVLRIRSSVWIVFSVRSKKPSRPRTVLCTDPIPSSEMVIRPGRAAASISIFFWSSQNPWVRTSTNSLMELAYRTNSIVDRFKRASPPLKTTWTGPSHSRRSLSRVCHCSCDGRSSWPRFFQISQWIQRALHLSVISNAMEVGRHCEAQRPWAIVRRR